MDNNSFYGFQPFGNLDNFDTQHSDFNPLSQYEQGYLYYKFLTQQLEYKIKCKEYEKLNNAQRENRNERRAM